MVLVFSVYTSNAVFNVFADVGLGARVCAVSAVAALLFQRIHCVYVAYYSKMYLMSKQANKQLTATAFTTQCMPDKTDD